MGSVRLAHFSVAPSGHVILSDSILPSLFLLKTPPIDYSVLVFTTLFRLHREPRPPLRFSFCYAPRFGSFAGIPYEIHGGVDRLWFFGLKHTQHPPPFYIVTLAPLRNDIFSSPSIAKLVPCPFFRTLPPVVRKALF